MTVEYLLGNARNDDHINMIVQWFKNGVISNTKGELLDKVEISKKHKHTMMERIWSSLKIELKEKEALLAELEKIDPEGDWLSNTKRFCEAAHPANKEKFWKFYFSQDAKDLEEIEKWGLYDY